MLTKLKTTEEFILHSRQLLKVYGIFETMRRIALLLIPIILFFLSSCKKERNPLTWNTDNYLPIAHGELGIADIVADSLLGIQSDSSVHFVLEQNLYTLNLDSIVTIPDTSLTDTFAVPFPVPVTISPGQVFINQPADNQLQIEDVELTSIYIKDAEISYSLKSTIEGDVTYVYSIPSSSDVNGNPFEQEVFVPSANGSYSSVSGSFHISDFTINLEGSDGNDVNILQTNINVKVTETNDGNITVSSSDTLYVENSMKSIQIGSATGYFGQYQASFGPESSPFDAFNKIISGGINLSTVNADFIVYNGVGADLSFQLDNLTASNSSSSLAFQNSIIGQQQHINRAYKSGGTIIPSIFQTNFDINNSNIDYLLELLPNELSYAGNFNLNPLGNVSGGNDFIDENFPLKVDLNLEIPLNIGINELTFQDTISLSDSLMDKLNSLSLHLDLNNGFPLEAKIYIGLLDQNNMLVEEIVSNNTILKANYLTDLKHTSQVSSYHEIALTPYQTELVKATPKFVLKVILDSESTDVTIYDYYKINYTVDAYLNNQISINNEQ